MKKQAILLWVCVVLFCSCTKKPPKGINSEAEILSFHVGSAFYSVYDSTVEHTYYVNSPDISQLRPRIVASEHATVVPPSGIAQDFTKPVVYRVTAEDGSQASYLVKVKVNPHPKEQESNPSTPSSETTYEETTTETNTPPPVAAIKSFTIAGLQLRMDGDRISYTFKEYLDIKALTPTIELTAQGSLSPASGVAQDFTNPVVYTLRSASGEIQTYTVQIDIQSKAYVTNKGIIKLNAPTQVPTGEIIRVLGKNYTVVDNGTIRTQLTSAYSRIITSKVTDMSKLFSTMSTFNESIGSWDMSNVTTTESMFKGARSFNQPIENWDMSKVKNMNSMFFGAASFNQPIKDWNLSNVNEMGRVFLGAETFNQPLNTWRVDKVTTFYGMFSDAKAFNQPLDKWNVSSATDMNFMFNGSKAFNQNLSKWCVSSILSKPNEFDTRATSWTQPKPNWGTCTVRN